MSALDNERHKMNRVNKLNAVGVSKGEQQDHSLKHSECRAIHQTKMRQDRPDLALISIQDVEGLVGCTRNVIYRLEEEGRFPKRIKLGHKIIRYRLCEIEAWFSEQDSDAPCSFRGIEQQKAEVGQ